MLQVPVTEEPDCASTYVAGRVNSGMLGRVNVTPLRYHPAKVAEPRGQTAQALVDHQACSSGSVQRLRLEESSNEVPAGARYVPGTARASRAEGGDARIAGTGDQRVGRLPEFDDAG